MRMAATVNVVVCLTLRISRELWQISPCVATQCWGGIPEPQRQSAPVSYDGCAPLCNREPTPFRPISGHEPAIERGSPFAMAGGCWRTALRKSLYTIYHTQNCQ